MKNHFILFAIFIWFYTIGNLSGSELFSKNLPDKFQESSKKHDLGFQIKYLSGIGLSANYHLNDKSYLHTSLSWMVVVINSSLSFAYKTNRYIDLYIGVNSFIPIAGSDNNYQPFFNPELGLRIKLSNKIFLDAGAFIPLRDDDRDILTNVFGVPFIPNVGFSVYFF